MLAIIILARGLIGLDPDRRDARVVEYDTEEGKDSRAWRGRNKTAEYPLTVAIEILDPRPAPVWFSSIRLVNVCEDRAEAADRCWASPVGARYEEQSFCNIAAHRSEQTRQAEGTEDGAVGGIVEEHGQAAR